MLTRSQLVLAVAAFVLLTLAASAFVTTSTAKRAEARCLGGGSPVLASRYNDNGTLVAQEYVTWPGTTCDGDWSYVGAVLDPVTDGSCAYVYYLEPLAYLANQGTSCTTGAWSVYSYNDSIGTNNVFLSVRPSYLADSWLLSSGY